MRLRLGTSLALLTVATVALAMPSYKSTFTGVYKTVPAGSALDKALKSPSGSCAVCHATVPALNKFGIDLQKAMKQLKVDKVTTEVLKQVETLDSDADGATNIAEIKAGTLPGDARSKPAPAPKPSEEPAHPAESPAK